MSIEFIDLKAQQKRIKPEIDAGIAKVLSEGRYIMGPEVKELEHELSVFGKAAHVLGCANGTDALLLPMIAWNIPRGAAVFCPSFTYCATAEIIAIMGAVPIFVDIDRNTYNMCPQSLKSAIEEVKADKDMEMFGVIAVDLFGQSANYEAIAPIAKEHNLKLISDSAQGFGTTLNGKHPLAWCDVSTTSFFPAKPLGCYGDGGAVLTNNSKLSSDMDSVRIHGKGIDKYDNVRVGLNSRLDTIQAAILLPKLRIFSDEIRKRNEVAMRYNEGLGMYALRIPKVLDGVLSTWAQYTIEVPNHMEFAAKLKDKGIPTARYYPKPVHIQTAYKKFPIVHGGLPNTMDCINNIISLPMHPYLDETTQDLIIETAKKALN